MCALQNLCCVIIQLGTQEIEIRIQRQGFTSFGFGDAFFE